MAERYSLTPTEYTAIGCENLSPCQIPPHSSGSQTAAPRIADVCSDESVRGRADAFFSAHGDDTRVTFCQVIPRLRCLIPFSPQARRRPLLLQEAAATLMTINLSSVWSTVRSAGTFYSARKANEWRRACEYQYPLTSTHPSCQNGLGVGEP